MEIAVVNDNLMPLKELDPVYMDRATYFGDGVYEVVRSYDGVLFALDEHLERFERSVKEIGINFESISQIKDTIIRAFNESGIVNAKVYFHLTRGSELRNHVPKEGLKPNFFMTVTELQDDEEKGIAVSLYPDLRWKRCDIKSLNLLANIMARMDAEKKGAQEAILVNESGEITEGAGSCFFVIQKAGKQLITRPLGKDILPSITRLIITQIAEKSGFKIVEKVFTPEQAKNVDEMFVAVTTKDIQPVIKFDGSEINGGIPGELTLSLKRAFKEEVKNRINKG